MVSQAEPEKAEKQTFNMKKANVKTPKYRVKEDVKGVHLVESKLAFSQVSSHFQQLFNHFSGSFPQQKRLCRNFPPANIYYNTKEKILQEKTTNIFTILFQPACFM